MFFFFFFHSCNKFALRRLIVRNARMQNISTSLHFRTCWSDANSFLPQYCFYKTVKVWLKRKKKIFGTLNCVGSRKTHWLVVYRARFMYMMECQAQNYNCCYKRKIRPCLTQGYNSPPSCCVSEKSISLVSWKSRVLIWTKFISRGMGERMRWAGLYNEENYRFRCVICRDFICLVRRWPRGDAFKALLADSSMELKPVSMW